MRIDAAQVALRPRAGWEAADLGFVMARAWWRPVWSAWLAAFLPVALVLHLLFRDDPAWAAAILWWLKPMFDRVALHVLGQAVFGAPPPLLETLRAWRSIVHPGLFAALTWRRLTLVRSFVLPVGQLERLRGQEASRRRAALGGRDRGYAAALTVVCAQLELVLLAGFGMLAEFLHPAAGALAPDLAAWWQAGDGAHWTLREGLGYVVAVSIVEPLYVAAGFALYLNRRTLLECWDIELSLRALGRRLAPQVAIGVLVLALLGGWSATETFAAEKYPREEIKRVMQDPEFQQWRDGAHWEYRGKPTPPPEVHGLEHWGNLLRFLAELAQSAGWIAIALGAAALGFAAWRYAGKFAIPRMERYRAPETLFGLAVAPASLPADIAGAAIAQAQAGRIREALSLLYRGALSALVHRHEAALADGATEGDCLRSAARVLDQAGARYFGELVAAWQTVAYARRELHAERVETLAHAWRTAFADPP